MRRKSSQGPRRAGPRALDARLGTLCVGRAFRRTGESPALVFRGCVIFPYPPSLFLSVSSEDMFIDFREEGWEKEKERNTDGREKR